MRIRITLDLTNKVIPINYHSLLQGFIYSALPNNEETSKLHNEGQKLQNRKFKLFTFSEIYGKTEYIKETKTLIFKDNGYFDFTAFGENIVHNVYHYIEQNNKLILGNQIIPIIKYDILNDSFDQKSIVSYATSSPVLIYRTENKSVTYFEPYSIEFYQILINNIIEKYYLCYGQNIENKPEYTITNVKKKKVHFRKIFYIGYHFRITFTNMTKELNYLLLTTGLGAKNSLGFGMITRIDEKKNILI